jgi:hypothetical protein
MAVSDALRNSLNVGTAVASLQPQVLPDITQTVVVELVVHYTPRIVFNNVHLVFAHLAFYPIFPVGFSYFPPPKINLLLFDCNAIHNTLLFN